MSGVKFNYPQINALLESIQEQLAYEEADRFLEAFEAELGEDLPDEVKSASRAAFAHSGAAGKGGTRRALDALAAGGGDLKTHAQTAHDLHTKAAGKALKAGLHKLADIHFKRAALAKRSLGAVGRKADVDV